MIYSYIYLSFINFNIFKLTNKQEARFKTNSSYYYGITRIEIQSPPKNYLSIHYIMIY
ncbi:hypothetical protein SAMN05444375_10724 [Segatella baroniae B14]|jgi:hypothetical protein|nr:hypothetical protein SAMN05444375_10724 [Segatella baroniae B14]